MRKENIKAVCSNDEARQYFKDKGLTYDDVTGGDIFTLTRLLNKHIEAAVKDHETSIDSMCLSKRVAIQRKENGAIAYCFLYLDSHYFEERECISFNRDGFIGFAGWASQRNTNPILRAFLEWCDILASQKPEAAAEPDKDSWLMERFKRVD